MELKLNPMENFFRSTRFVLMSALKVMRDQYDDPISFEPFTLLNVGVLFREIIYIDHYFREHQVYLAQNLIIICAVQSKE